MRPVCSLLHLCNSSFVVELLLRRISKEVRFPLLKMAQCSIKNEVSFKIFMIISIYDSSHFTFQKNDYESLFT